jgi:hypothetical protein
MILKKKPHKPSPPKEDYYKPSKKTSKKDLIEVLSNTRRRNHYVKDDQDYDESYDDRS